MRRHLFTLLALIVAALAALLIWAWATDFFLIEKCLDAGGVWDDQARICRIELNPGPEGLASLRR
jgi:hypothetical protein